MDKAKLHWTRKRLIDRIEAQGGGVMCEWRDGTRHYAYLTTGREIGRGPIEALIGLGYLRGEQDGLFGDAQTYRICRSAQ